MILLVLKSNSGKVFTSLVLLIFVIMFAIVGVNAESKNNEVNPKIIETFELFSKGFVDTADVLRKETGSKKGESAKGFVEHILKGQVKWQERNDDVVRLQLVVNGSELNYSSDSIKRLMSKRLASTQFKPFIADVSFNKKDKSSFSISISQKSTESKGDPYLLGRQYVLAFLILDMMAIPALEMDFALDEKSGDTFMQMIYPEKMTIDDMVYSIDAYKNMDSPKRFHVFPILENEGADSSLLTYLQQDRKGMDAYKRVFDHKTQRVRFATSLEVDLKSMERSLKYTDMLEMLDDMENIENYTYYELKITQNGAN